MGREFLSKKIEKKQRATPSIMRRRSREYSFEYLDKTQSNYLDGVIRTSASTPSSSSSPRCLDGEGAQNEHQGQIEERLQVNGPIVRSSIVYLQ